MKPIAQGALRRVYVHPERPDYVVKVVRPEVIERRWGRKSSLYKRFRRSLHFVAIEREIEEFLAAYAKHGEHAPFLQRVIGFTDTDIGLGFITEAVVDRSGNIASDLGKLVADGLYDTNVRDAFEQFARDFLASDLVISDFSAQNLVYGWTQEHGNRLVLIDGLGCSTFIPVKAWFPYFNRKSKRYQLDRIRRLLPKL
jgi:hypothetical protein